MKRVIVKLLFLLFLCLIAVGVNGEENEEDGFPSNGRSKRSREHSPIADQEVRTIISAIVDAILDGDKKKRSNLELEEDEIDERSSQTAKKDTITPDPFIIEDTRSATRISNNNISNNGNNYNRMSNQTSSKVNNSISTTFEVERTRRGDVKVSPSRRQQQVLGAHIMNNIINSEFKKNARGYIEQKDDVANKDPSLLKRQPSPLTSFDEIESASGSGSGSSISSSGLEEEIGSGQDKMANKFEEETTETVSRIKKPSTNSKTTPSTNSMTQQRVVSNDSNGEDTLYLKNFNSENLADTTTQNTSNSFPSTGSSNSVQENEDMSDEASGAPGNERPSGSGFSDLGIETLREDGDEGTSQQLLQGHNIKGHTLEEHEAAGNLLMSIVRDMADSATNSNKDVGVSSSTEERSSVVELKNDDEDSSENHHLTREEIVVPEQIPSSVPTSQNVEIIKRSDIPIEEGRSIEKKDSINQNYIGGSTASLQRSVGGHKSSIENTADLRQLKQSRTVSSIAALPASLLRKKADVNNPTTLRQKNNVLWRTTQEVFQSSLDVSTGDDEKDKSSMTAKKSSAETKVEEELFSVMKLLLDKATNDMEHLSKRRLEQEEDKLERDLVDLVGKNGAAEEDSVKANVVTEIKDYEGYLKALSHHSISSWKHEMIVHKLEHDLLNHLGITEQEERQIKKQEDAFTKFSEVQILKERISDMEESSISFAAKHSGNLAKIKQFAMRAAKNVIHALPLERSHKKELLESVAPSAWIRMISNTKRSPKASKRLARTLMRMH